MKIDLTKKQYIQLMKLVQIGNGVVSQLGDFVNEKHKTNADEYEELEQYFLTFAKEYDCEYMKDDAFFEEEAMPVLDEYDDFISVDHLANQLAWRDFKRTHTQEEIVKMEIENQGYFGAELHPFEEKYWNEFEIHGTKRLEIVEKKEYEN